MHLCQLPVTSAILVMKNKRLILKDIYSLAFKTTLTQMLHMDQQNAN